MAKKQLVLFKEDIAKAEEDVKGPASEATQELVDLLAAGSPGKLPLPVELMKISLQQGILRELIDE